MAALSVHMAVAGQEGGMPGLGQAGTRPATSPELAATPPARARPLGPEGRRPPGRALVTNTSTTASWKEAATSAWPTSGDGARWLVPLRSSGPLKEKS